jgi:hypothetical protein
LEIANIRVAQKGRCASKNAFTYFVILPISPASITKNSLQGRLKNLFSALDGCAIFGSRSAAAATL